MVLQEIFNASFNKDQIYTRCPTPVQDRPHPYPLLIVRKEERADGPRPAATAIQADNLPLSLAASKPGPGQPKKRQRLSSLSFSTVLRRSDTLDDPFSASTNRNRM